MKEYNERKWSAAITLKRNLKWNKISWFVLSYDHRIYFPPSSWEIIFTTHPSDILWNLHSFFKQKSTFRDAFKGCSTQNFNGPKFLSLISIDLTEKMCAKIWVLTFSVLSWLAFNVMWNPIHSHYTWSLLLSFKSWK